MNFRFIGILLTLAVWCGGGCYKFAAPESSARFAFENRMQSETQQDLTVSVAVPTRAETEKIFGVDLYAKKMQPVWVKVENRSKDQLSLLQTSIDPEYYSPNEAAYKSKEGYGKSARWKREIFFQKNSLPLNLPPHSETSGFVITHLEQGTKFVTLDILTESDVKRFQYLIELPLETTQYTEVDLDTLYPAEQIRDLTLEQLRQEIESLPCCTAKTDKKTDGDPINLVLVGQDEETLSALVRSGWVKTLDRGDAGARPYEITLAKRPFQYQLRTPLWFLDRPQDLGFHKPRQSDDGRTQFWLWLTPWRYQGKRVWIGTLTRDIGLRYSVESPYLKVTHKIDSDVDETRDFLLEDLISIGAVAKLGWVEGVGYAPPDAPRKDSTGDHWYTDGLRLVLFISDQPRDLQEIEVLNWEFPPNREVLPQKRTAP